MNLLLIDKKEKNKQSHRINIGFLSSLPGVFRVPVFSQKEKKIIMSPDTLYKKYSPDVVICNSHSPLLTKYFSNIPCLKIMVSVDYHKIIQRDKRFYIDNKFDLIAYRHKVDKKNKDLLGGTPSFWLPWCADEEVFFPGNKTETKIGFCGSYKADVYSPRKKYIKELEKEDLLKNCRKRVNNYPELIRKHRFMLNSSELNSPYAKVFEMLSSKTAVFSPPFSGEEELFGKNIIYKFKESSVVDKAKKMMKDPDLETKVNRGYNIFKEHHTQNKRIEELYFNILRLYRGKSIKNFWG